MVKALQKKEYKTTEAQRRAAAKWDQEHTEKMTIKLYPTSGVTKAQIAAAADACGQSVNAWIVDAIKQAL